LQPMQGLATVMGKLSIGVVKLYNDAVVQAVTFAYVIYCECFLYNVNTSDNSRCFCLDWLSVTFLSDMKSVARL